MLLVGLNVTIPPWGSPTASIEEQEEYDEEDIQTLVREHITLDEEEQGSYEPDVKNPTTVFCCSTQASPSTLNRVGTSAGLI